MFNAETEGLVLANYLIALAIGGLGLWVAWRGSRTPGMFDGVRLFCIVLAASGFAAGGAWLLVTDFMLAREHVVGTVEHVHITTSARPTRYWRRYYEVQVDRRRYSAIGDVYRDLHVGDRVRMQFGKGSRKIFRIEPADDVL